MSNDKIYPTMVIRSQAEAIELQKKEIERLGERIAYLERSNNRREDEIMSLRDECVDSETYKLRNEKAIEYCNKEIGNIIANFDYIDTKDLENVRNILKGSDKE